VRAPLLCPHAALFLPFFVADEEFNNLCFEFGIELDEIVRSPFDSLLSLGTLCSVLALALLPAL
jgi:hypothetical protein